MKKENIEIEERLHSAIMQTLSIYTGGFSMWERLLVLAGAVGAAIIQIADTVEGAKGKEYEIVEEFKAVVCRAIAATRGEQGADRPTKNVQSSDHESKDDEND